MTVRAVSFELNGEPVSALARPLETLQSVLRDQLGMTGTKAGCRQGVAAAARCGWTGEPVLACLVPVEHAEGHSVTTIEGVGSAAALSPVQATFYERFAVECGFCSPGMITVATALLERNPDPTRAEITEALAGNVCRCTGIVPIVDAIEEAASRMREREGATA